MSYFRRFVPPLPPVPRLLWLTLAVAGLAVLNLVFYAEIWSGKRPNHALMEDSVLVALSVLGPQVLALLWHWPVPNAVPLLWRVVFWLVTRATLFVGALVYIGILLVTIYSIVCDLLRLF